MILGVIFKFNNDLNLTENFLSALIRRIGPAFSDNFFMQLFIYLQLQRALGLSALFTTCSFFAEESNALRTKRRLAGFQ